MVNDNTLAAAKKLITFGILKMAKNLSQDMNVPKIGN